MFKRHTSNIAATGKLWLGAASLGLASTVGAAGGLNQGTGGASFVTDSRPVATSAGTDNATPNTHRALIADGSSLHQAWAGDSVKWYAVLIEPGKTYVVDALDPYTDYPSGSVSGLGIYESDGTTTPPAETNVNCAASAIAPGASNFGKRCIIRAFSPVAGYTKNIRQVYIRVARYIDTAFQIRVRESTVYGRWTTNGYDFHVEVQNTTSEAMCAQVVFYPNSGMTYTAGAWTGPTLLGTSLTIPPFGAQQVRASERNPGRNRQSGIAAHRRVPDAGHAEYRRGARQYAGLQPVDQSVPALLHDPAQRRQREQFLT